MKTESNQKEPVCPTCNAPIPADAPGGLCPACVLQGSQSVAETRVEAAAPSVEQIGEAFPDLEDIELIGRGGMGAVYRARQKKLDRELALKILLPDLGADPAFAERFTREARSLAKLNHPNIVSVFDFGEQDGLFFLTMEYVDGVNLRQAMGAGSFTPQQALAVIPGICDALEAAHKVGILHRDIKPENILLDREGMVKIVDFGIARMVGDSASDFTLTSAGAMLGTRQYMAPEQVERPHEVDHRADIYSLGVVFYEMLTGELPIGRFLPPSEKAPTSADIDAVVMRALEKELDRRFQSVGEVRTGVEGAARSPAPTAARQPERKPKGSVGSEFHAVFGNCGFITAASLVLLIGGVVFFFGMGFLLAGASRTRGMNIVVCLVLMSPGLIATILGYIGCWISLSAIKRGRIAKGGHSLLQTVVIGIPALIFGAIATAFAQESLRFPGRADVYIVMGMAAIGMMVLTFLLARLSGVKLPGAARAWVTFAALLIGFSTLAHAMYSLGSYPFIHSVASESINFERLPENVGEEELRQAAHIAAGKHADAYDIKVKGSRVHVSLMHVDRSSGLPKDHINAFKQRLQDALPADAITSRSFRDERNTPPWVQFNIPATVTAYMLAILVAAFGLALVGGTSGGIGFVVLLLAFIGGAISPPLPRPDNAPKVVEGAALEIPDSPPRPRRVVIPEFSTPESAARNIVAAAYAGDREALRAAITEGMDKEQVIDSLIKFFNDSNRFLGIEKVTQPSHLAGGKMVGIKIQIVSRRGGSTGSYSTQFFAILDEWKLGVPD